MNVKVLLFAHLKEMANCSDISLELPANATGEVLLDKLIERYPEADKLRNYLRLSMNGDYITPEDEIVEGSEIAIFPPVSGGA